MRRIVKFEQGGGEGGEEAVREGGGDSLASLHHRTGCLADREHWAPQEMNRQLREGAREEEGRGEEEHETFDKG